MNKLRIFTLSLVCLFALNAHAYVTSGFPSQNQPVHSMQHPNNSPQQHYHNNNGYSNNNGHPNNVYYNNTYYYGYGGYDDSDDMDDDDSGYGMDAGYAPSESTGQNWINADYGDVPGDAVIYNYVDGNAVYRCRVNDGSDYLYGVLYQGQGCLINNSYDNEIYDSYDVLVSD